MWSAARARTDSHGDKLPGLESEVGRLFDGEFEMARRARQVNVALETGGQDLSFSHENRGP